VDEYCTFWDTEYARLGESHTSLPPAYLAVTSTGAGAALGGGIIGGYAAWARAGRPSDPSICSASVAASGQSDSTQAIIAACEAALGSCSKQHSVATQATSESHRAPQLSPAQSIMGPVVARQASTASTGPSTGAESQRTAENEAAADLFLRQVLGCVVTDTEDQVSDDNEQGNDDGQGEGYDGTIAANEAPMAAINVVIDEEGEPLRRRHEEGPHPPSSADQEPGEEMVYSRLHGYKIKVSSEPSNAIYRKILSEIAPDKLAGPDDGRTGAEGHDGQKTTASATIGSTYQRDARPSTGAESQRTAENEAAAVPVFRPLDSSAPHYEQYRAHYWASQVQWRPLRATAESDAAAAEEQPERVIFSDDLRPSLFDCSLPPQPGVADAHIADLNRRLRARLIMRCLQALGVRLPHCEVSHAPVRRFSAVLCDGALSILGAVGGTTLQRFSDACVPTECRSMSSVTLEQDESQLCVVSPALLESHVLCCRTRYDSRLNFAVRLVAEVVGLSGRVSMLLAPSFVSQLRVVLVQLLTARQRSEQAVLPADRDRQVALELWRTQCRGVIEASVCDAGATIAGSGSSQQVPAVGDLAVWAAYLSAEHTLGYTTEALKVCGRCIFACTFVKLITNECLIVYVYYLCACSWQTRY
jgi:hypothetical protein